MVKLGWGPTSLIELELGADPGAARRRSGWRSSAGSRDRAARQEGADRPLQLDIVGIIDFDRGEISVDASWSTRARHVRTHRRHGAADRLGRNKIVRALAAGGFHPSSSRRRVPELDRLAISLATGDNPRLRLESYFALTANTVQFGAQIDIYAKVDTFVGSFSAAAYAQLRRDGPVPAVRLRSPTWRGIDIAPNDKPFLQRGAARLAHRPAPWHAVGYVGVRLPRQAPDRRRRHRRRGRPAAARPIDCWAPLVAKALEAADAWAAELPRRGGQLVDAARPPRPSCAGRGPSARRADRPAEGCCRWSLRSSKFGQAVPRRVPLDRFAITRPRSSSASSRRTCRGHVVVGNHRRLRARAVPRPDRRRRGWPGRRSSRCPRGVRVGTAARRWPTAGAAPPRPGWRPTGLRHRHRRRTRPQRQGRDGQCVAPPRPTPEVLEDWLLAAAGPRRRRG